MKLFHVSEEPDIAQFVPRTPLRNDLDQTKKFVWAINEQCLPNFLAPRECPRVTFRADENTSEEDVARFFSTSRRHCMAIEHAWFERMRNTTLYLYELDPANFCLQDQAAGYYVSEQTEAPIAKTQIDDIFGALFERGVEVRLVDHLWELSDVVIASTLCFSNCDMANARSRRLFTRHIASWDDWGKVYQSIPAFRDLIAHIFAKENLPMAEIGQLEPGTNAVFRVGGYVVKIFAPNESGMDQTLDLQTELFAIQRANALGIAAPKLIAHGFVQDKYRFAYLIMEFIEGKMMLEDDVKRMPNQAKYEFGRKLRTITDKMNTPCECFNGIDIVNDEDRWERWRKFPVRFQTERRDYLASHAFGASVFVHGDLNGDNILMTAQGDLAIIDFADAVLAPVEYEHALVAATFDFDKAFLRGYFENDTANLDERCFHGILIHAFGGDIVAERICGPEEITGLERLREKIYAVIEEAVS